MDSSHLACQEYGDAGLLIDVLADDPDVVWARVQSIGDALRSQPPAGLVDVVAAFASVFVSFDPLVTDRPTLIALVEDIAGEPLQPRKARHFVVPVVYGGSFGPDLDATADLLGLTADEVVDAHSGEEWMVRFVASPIGAPLMEGPKLPAALPRLANPRPRVEPGSVGLSGFQSIVYNAASPGGWQLIGRTPAALFDLATPPHVAYAAGDLIRFRPVAESEWDRWVGHVLLPEDDA